MIFDFAICYLQAPLRHCARERYGSAMAAQRAKEARMQLCHESVRCRRAACEPLLHVRAAQDYASAILRARMRVEP